MLAVFSSPPSLWRGLAGGGASCCTRWLSAPRRRRALAALGTWLLFALFWSVITPLIAKFDRRAARGVFGPRMEFLQAQTHHRPPLAQHALCRERARAVAPGDARPGTGIDQQLQGALLGAPLPASQSFHPHLPQLTGLIAATIVIFVIAYIAFQRQEIRA